MIPGSWQHVLMVSLLLAIAAGSLILRPKKRGASRLRKLRDEPLPDPWSGAIVRHQKFYVSHWSSAVGRAYRN